MNTDLPLQILPSSRSISRVSSFSRQLGNLAVHGYWRVHDVPVQAGRDYLGPSSLAQVFVIVAKDLVDLALLRNYGSEGVCCEVPRHLRLLYVSRPSGLSERRRCPQYLGTIDRDWVAVPVLLLQAMLGAKPNLIARGQRRSEGSTPESPDRFCKFCRCI